MPQDWQENSKPKDAFPYHAIPRTHITSGHALSRLYSATKTLHLVVSILGSPYWHIHAQEMYAETFNLVIEIVNTSSTSIHVTGNIFKSTSPNIFVNSALKNVTQSIQRPTFILRNDIISF